MPNAYKKAANKNTCNIFNIGVPDSITIFTKK